MTPIYSQNFNVPYPPESACFSRYSGEFRRNAPTEKPKFKKLGVSGAAIADGGRAA